MPVDLKVPSPGESINEVFIGAWSIAEGEWIARDENVVELETDKATFDVPAPVSGILVEVLKQQGETAEVGEVIARIREAEQPEDSGDSSKKAAASGGDSSSSRNAGKSGSKSESGKSRKKGEDDSAGDGNGTRVMPAAARLIEENDLEAGDIPATGPGNRLLKEDVQRYLDHQVAAEAESRPSSSSQGREEKRVPMSPIRRRIAERLVEAQQNAALLTTFNEIDMSTVMELRTRFKETFLKKFDVKLGFMSFFVKAVVDALNEVPQLNAQIDGDDLVHRNYSDIGIAVGGGKGLVVPVIRNAERLSFAEIEQTINDFAKRARENRIGLDEMQGGSLTISNGGIYGSLLSTPIVNPPQSGVLGMHAIQDRPIAVNGEIVIRPMMYVALTYDHRVVDGREAVTFLKRIKEVIEDPSRMVLEC